MIFGDLRNFCYLCKNIPHIMKDSGMPDNLSHILNEALTSKVS